MNFKMQEEYAKELLEKYRSGKCSAEELQLLQKWFLNFEMEDIEKLGEPDFENAGTGMWKPIWKKTTERFPRRLYLQLASAAAILIFIGIGFYFQKSKPTNSGSAVSFVEDIEPGQYKATLVRKNGIKEDLKGQLFEVSADKKAEPLDTNIVVTPNGGSYQVILGDGTHVWLNAGSSLSYPSTFVANIARVVRVKGEAYFQVAKDGSRFIVETGNQQIEVLGTHFNINNYENEPTAVTTLLEGSVKVTAGNEGVTLKPGEQAVVQRNTEAIHVSETDIDQAIAWKNGFFQFKRAGLTTVMRQLARWYDVEVSYEGKISQKEFTGKVYRNLNASQALEVLRYFEVNFKIEGRKIIVTD